MSKKKHLRIDNQRSSKSDSLSLATGENRDVPGLKSG
jgi:hypothetical protein